MTFIRAGSCDAPCLIEAPRPCSRCGMVAVQYACLACGELQCATCYDHHCGDIDDDAEISLL